MLILSHSKQKGGLIREMISLKGDNLVVLSYLGAFEIWPDKRGNLWWEEPYKSRTTVLYLDQDFKSEINHFTVVSLVYFHLFLQY